MTTSTLANKGMLVDPGDHFVGDFEVERKYAVDDISQIRSRLDGLGAVAFTLGNFESDFFFDFDDGRLASNDQFQVLRHMQPSDRVLWISKGPGPDRCVAMDLNDLEKAKAMLTSLGFVQTNQISKQRDIYFLDVFHVTLDQVPNLGHYVELAVMSNDEALLPTLAEKINALAKTLGLLSSALEHRSYREMFLNLA